MKIIINPDKEIVVKIKDLIKKNNGYCPCVLEKNEDTKCMCKDFLEQEIGECHCGLYIRIE